MKAEFRTWDDQNRAWAAKLVLRPETPEELDTLQAFATHTGVDLNGRKIEVVWSWDRVTRNRKKLAARQAARDAARPAPTMVPAGSP